MRKDSAIIKFYYNTNLIVSEKGFAFGESSPLNPTSRPLQFHTVRPLQFFSAAVRTASPK
jgi:hypothetical protein